MNHSETRGLRSRIARFGAAIIGLTCTLYASPGFTQTTALTHAHESDFDLKNYATEWRADNSQQFDETVMAGTAWRVRHHKSLVHFLRLDIDGNIMRSMLYDLGTTTEVSVVDIAVIDIKTFAITVWERPDFLQPNNDGIRVLIVNENGSLISEGRVMISDPVYKNLYPTHSMWHDNVLYICGYTTEEYGYHYPTFSTDKRAFVLKYDVASMFATSIQTYDWNVAGATYDFDIATRMKLASDGNIFVTGSTNFSKLDPSSGSYQPVSGTMSMLIGPGSLSPVPGLPDNPNTFSGKPYANPAGVWQEYGTDMIELPNSSGTTDFYVISNTYYDMGDPTVGFSFQPNNLCISVVGSDLNNYNSQVSPIDTRVRYDGHHQSEYWGLQVMPGVNGANNVMIAGLQTNQGTNSCITAPNPMPSQNNFNPFLLDCSLTFNTANGLTAATNSWNTLLSVNGTGNSANPNSYYRLGYGPGHWGWNPTFAARIPSHNDDIALYAPWENNAGTKLNLKYIRTDANGQGPGTGAYGDPGCKDNVIPCNTYVAPPEEIVDDSYYGNPSGYTPAPPSGVINTYPGLISSQPPLGNDYFCISGSYKQGGTGLSETIAEEDKVMVYPNPVTNGRLHIKLNGIADDEQLRMELVNIYGQRLQILYDDKALNLRTTGSVQLKDLPQGLYMVNVYINGKLSKVEKLHIE